MASGKAPALQVLVQHRVSRVVFNSSRRATAVECEPSTAFYDGTPSKSPPRVIHARKLIVVSAGAVGSPCILERSGIGSPAILEPLDIRVVSDIPEVGENYSDHQMMRHAYRTSLAEDQTMDCFHDGREDLQTAVANKDPRMGWNTLDISAKIRPTEEEVQDMGTDFQELWAKEYRNKADKPLAMLTVACR